MAYCGNCGIQLDKDAKFCSICGTPVEQNSTSEESGKTVKQKKSAEDDGNVKQQVYDATDQQIASNKQNPPKKKKTKAKIIIPIVIAAVLIAAGIGAYFLFGRYYTVTLDTDGGSPVDPIRVEIGEKIKFIENPTKEGYNFTGWSEDPESEWIVSFPYKPEGNCTLYAKWVPKSSNGAGSKSYSTPTAAKAALNEYAIKLETNSKKLYEFATNVYNPDLPLSYTIHQKDRQNFNDLQTEILSSLQTSNGEWLVDKKVMTIPASCDAIRSDLVKASNLLRDRINILNSAYLAIMKYNDSSPEYKNNRTQYVQDVTNASNNALKDSQAKYDEYNKAYQAAKEQLNK